jgi:hypothetical protein
VLRLKKGTMRRVRKNREKEAAGAADAGSMQIEWSEAEGLKLGGLVKADGVAAAHLCKDESIGGMSRVRKKLSWGN